MVVLLVGAQMLGEVVDPLGQHGDLDLGRTGVRVALAELRDQLLLALARKGAHRRGTVAERRLPGLLKRRRSRAWRRRPRASARSTRRPTRSAARRAAARRTRASAAGRTGRPASRAETPPRA